MIFYHCTKFEVVCLSCSGLIEETLQHYKTFERFCPSLYATSTLCITQFCDRWGINEEAQMPASYPLLCTFIGEYKGRQAGNTIRSWLSGIHAWHVINHAPWFRADEWVQLAH